MFVREVASNLRERMHEEIQLEELADAFGYSRFHFSRRFKKESGFTIKEFISLLKMEHAIVSLLEDHKSILEVQLESGYESTGTFSKQFLKNTGMSPRAYRKSVEALYDQVMNLEKTDSQETLTLEEHPNEATKTCLKVRFIFPEGTKKGITFVGLFHKPIPNHLPIVGKAVFGGDFCTFEKVPKGRYYLMVCYLEKERSIIHYFNVKNCLRWKNDHAISFPLEGCLTKEAVLRGPLPEDPPILINLPHLLNLALHQRKERN